MGVTPSSFLLVFNSLKWLLKSRFQYEEYPFSIGNTIGNTLFPRVSNSPLPGHGHGWSITLRLRNTQVFVVLPYHFILSKIKHEKWKTFARARLQGEFPKISAWLGGPPAFVKNLFRKEIAGLELSVWPYGLKLNIIPIKFQPWLKCELGHAKSL